MRYIIYARKSTDSKERQVLSIESQVYELREFTAKEKLEIVASLCEAQTAEEPGRTKFAEMLSFLVGEVGLPPLGRRRGEATFAQKSQSENWRYLLDKIRTFFDENPDYDF